jgi:hypothetical protein
MLSAQLLSHVVERAWFMKSVGIGYIGIENDGVECLPDNTGISGHSRTWQHWAMVDLGALSYYCYLSMCL